MGNTKIDYGLLKISVSKMAKALGVSRQRLYVILSDTSEKNSIRRKAILLAMNFDDKELEKNLKLIEEEYSRF